MTRAALAAVAAFMLALPVSAWADPAQVSVEFQAFGPDQLDVLPGETVQWANVSERTHTVTADDGSFDSGDLNAGDQFTREFDSPGQFPYHCTKHLGMLGEVDVRPVILGPLPTAPIPAGDHVSFEGRTADPSQPVLIQRSTGGEFQTIATAAAAADGTWKASVPAQVSGDYRAATSAGSSGTRRLIVSVRKVLVRTTRRRLAVTVIPPLPYARIVLQADLRERFGWWPVLSQRLDYVSGASFGLPRARRIRVVLVDKDGWTPLVTSAVVNLPRPG